MTRNAVGVQCVHTADPCTTVEAGDGEVTVSDDGVGVPERLAAGPRGAGLSLSDALARQVGGRITMERDGRGGTVWRLTFGGPSRGRGALADTGSASDRDEIDQPATSV